MPIYVKSPISKKYFPENLYGKYGSFTLFPKEKFLSFKKARTFARKLKLKGYIEWKKFVADKKKPKNIPSNPQQVYKSEWISWKDFLGNEDRLIQSFEEAREKVHNCNIKFNSEKDWNKFHKMKLTPKGIPSNPNLFYKDKGWTNWSDFLGYKGRVRSKPDNFVSFKKCVEFARSLNFEKTSDWNAFLKTGKRPNNIPSSPYLYYKKEWKGYPYFLRGNTPLKKHNKFLSYEDSIKYVHQLNLKKMSDWLMFCKKGQCPNNIPHHPKDFYIDQWKGWGEWIGNPSYKTSKEKTKYNFCGKTESNLLP